MTPIWTREQSLAIHAKPSLLVSAAAGAGKTAVLAERIARLVREGADVRALLVVTFTEAAAQEMKQRVARRLGEAALEESGEAERARLRAQARAAAHGGGGNISTLHAFCLYLLRRNFHLLGLDPAFTTADDAQQAMLFEEALAQTAARLCEEEDAGYLALLRAVRGEKPLFEHARALHAFLMAQPAPWEWLEGAQAAYALDAAGFAAHPAMEERLAALRGEAEAALALIARARARTPVDYPRVLEILDDDAMQLRALLLQKSYPAACAAADAVKLRAFTGWPTASEPALREEVKALRDRARKSLGRLQKRPGPAQEAAALAKLRPQVAALAGFVRAVDECYAAKKRGRALVDFADMEHMALRALQNEGVAAALRERYLAIFVDEYQDSSRMQEALIERIRRPEGNLFLVGDVKQSIYRFRQAEPGLFLEKRAAYTDDPEGERKNGAVIHLNRNFRSAPTILSAVNAVFSRVMTPRAGELAYDANAALYPPEGAADTPLTGCALHIVEKRSGAGEDGEEELHDAQAEARAAGLLIRSLLEEETPPGARLLRYGDFVVLLRSHRGVAELWAATLAQMGIPAYAQLTGGYFDAIEVQVFLNLLRVIDNRRQDVPLLSVLRGVAGFTDAQLAALRAGAGAQEDVFGCLALCAAREGDPLAPRAAEVLKKIEEYRREALLLPLPALIAFLMEDTGFYACVGALPGGAQRQANLDALLERARALCGAADLAAFLRFMDQARDTADLGRAQAGGADVVRILSMHRAKGLEYPVVVLGGLGRPFNTRGRAANLSCDPVLGLGLRCAPEGGLRVDSPLREAIVQKAERQQRAEEMRILYVGMTRARQRLILLGSCKDGETRIAAAQEEDIAAPGWPGGAGCFLDWLLPVAVREKGLFHVAYTAREALANAAPPEPPPPPQEQEEDCYRALCARLRWAYPDQAATRVPSKVSVSALLDEGEPPAWQAHGRLCPPGEGEPGMTAAERGSAMHLLLAQLALRSCPAQEREILPWLARACDALVARGRMAARQAQGVALAQAAAFLASPLGRRLCAAARVERELEFSYPLPADELLGADTDAPVVLQGVIDCCFLENGQWVLLDYKTDFVPPGGAQEVAARHAGQLALYARALAGSSGIPVGERYVVLLRAGVSVALDGSW